MPDTISHRASLVPPGVEGFLLREAPRLVVALAVVEAARTVQAQAGVEAMQVEAAVGGAPQVVEAKVQAVAEAAQAVGAEAVVVEQVTVAAEAAEAWAEVEVQAATGRISYGLICRAGEGRASGERGPE
jgi:tRNA-binding EMAP/Myf-like protein